VNDIKSLGGIDSFDGLNSTTLNELLNDTKPAEGASSRTDVGGIEGSEPGAFEGQFGINTQVNGSLLILTFSDSTPSDSGAGFVEYQATQGEGRSLPEWISMTADGTMMIDAPAGVENISLQITGIRDDGVAVTRAVSVQVSSGLIREGGAKRTGGPTFSSALNDIVSDEDIELAAVQQLFVSGG